MAQIAKKRLVVRHGVVAAVAVAAGAVAASGAAATAAYADGAGVGVGTAQDSPGLLSGLSVQLPTTVPVDLCGSTVAVAGLLDPASGNHCANASSGSTATGATGSRTAAAATPRSAGVRAGGAGAGAAANSPGLLAGDAVHLPVALPVNLTGNSVNVVGLGSPASGNVSSNTSAPAPAPGVPVAAPQPPAVPGTAPQPSPVPPARRSLAAPPMLAHTGAQGLGDALAAGGALLAGGLALYRRAGRRPTHPRAAH